MGGKGCFCFSLCIYFSHTVSHPVAKHLFLTPRFIFNNQQRERITLLGLEKEGEEVLGERCRDIRVRKRGR